jgi:hypothetical protein
MRFHCSVVTSLASCSSELAGLHRVVCRSGCCCSGFGFIFQFFDAEAVAELFLRLIFWTSLLSSGNCFHRVTCHLSSFLVFVYRLLIFIIYLFV